METLTLVIGNKNYSTWSLRAWLVLAKAGVAFEEVCLPLDTPEFYERITDYSEAGLVPVLRWRGTTIHDSLAIAETVNEQFANGSLWPREPSVRALARALSAEIHSGFGALRSAMPMNIRARNRRVHIDPAVSRDIARIQSIWDRANPGSWLFGEFSIADAMFAPVALRFPTYGVELEGAAAKYQQHVLADPLVERWVELSSAETDIVMADETGIDEDDR